MDFNKLKLISAEESEKLFFIQNQLIKKIEMKDNTLNNILRLSILQTISPIEDYECAQKILENAFIEFKDFSLCIIGSYLCSKWCFDILEDIYLNFLIENYDKYSDRNKAIIEFLIALNLIKNNYCQKEVFIHLEKSVALCEELKNNKLLLSGLQSSDYNSIETNDFCKFNIEDAIDPNKFISEFIE